jgi:ATP synthase, F1 delta subunit
MSSRVGKRYAKAIYEYALGKGEETRVYEETKRISDTFSSYTSFSGIMNDPTVSGKEKKKVLVTAAGDNVSDSFKKAINLIFENKRESYILSIALLYQEHYRKQKGIFIAKLTTASTTMNEAQTRLKQIILQHYRLNVDFVKKTDPSIIGGFVLELNDTLLDASVKTQLNRMKYKLME